MASKKLHRQSANFRRYFSGSPFNAANNRAQSTATMQTNAPTFDVSDIRALFAKVTTPNLVRSAVNLKLASMEDIVDLGIRAMNSAVAQEANFLWRGLVLGAVRRTIFPQFCAGETAGEAMQSVERVNEAGLRGILDYAVEFAVDNGSCDANFEGFLRTVEASKYPLVSSVAVKVTALFPITLLERVSDLLRWNSRDSGLLLRWKELNFPIFADTSPFYHTMKEPRGLSSEEEEDLKLGFERVRKLCERCADVGIPLVVDAEHTQVQPAIDYVTYWAAMRHNKRSQVLVYNTIQTYLKDAKQRLVAAMQESAKTGVPIGFKLVRGAYLTSERTRAMELGFPPPIHETIEETHRCYNNCASILLEKGGSVILATHNVESGKMAAKKIRELGVAKKGNVEFAQLYGMADSLSYGLRNGGFQVSKYMPYGPVEKVIPYLIRRAEENRGVLAATGLDRELMRKELKRRAKAAISI